MNMGLTARRTPARAIAAAVAAVVLAVTGMALVPRAALAADATVLGTVNVQKVNSTWYQAMLAANTALARGIGPGPFGGSSFKGATFDLVYDGVSPVTYNGRQVSRGQVLASKSITTGTTVSFTGVPAGTYHLVESRAPDSVYAINSAWKPSLTIDSVGQVVNYTAVSDWENACPDDAKPIDVPSVSLVDATTGKATPEGDAHFKGATFELVNTTGGPVVYKGRTYKAGAVVATARVDSDTDPTATFGGQVTPGSYTIRQASAGDGYAVNESWACTFSLAGTSSTVCPDAVWRGGLDLAKVDADTLTSTPQGNAELAGAQFAIYNVSDHDVTVGGTTFATLAGADGTYDAGALDAATPVLSLTCDGDGLAQVAGTTLPYGTYVLRETKAPLGYTIDAEYASGVEFEITEDGQLYDMRTVDDPTPDYVDD